MNKMYAAIVIVALSWVGVVQAGELENSEELKGLQHEWAHINYDVTEDQKEAAFEALSNKAHTWSEEHHDQAEPLIWEAIIKSTYAGAKGGLGALSLMEEARDLLLKAEEIDAKALNGSIYTSLGSFYYMTPGWPIGFGDDDKAEEYLTKALEMAPNDMDANYFGGDFWLEEHKYKKAAEYLQKVIDLPDVESRPVYSKGRKAEAAKKLEKAKKHIH
jgi:tetratricopeptide (TPR) repeat protein